MQVKDDQAAVFKSVGFIKADKYGTEDEPFKWIINTDMKDFTYNITKFDLEKMEANLAKEFRGKPGDERIKKWFCLFFLGGHGMLKEG